jgi:inosine/xanthosine triphosphate pyrophosphatase family protein
MPRAFPACRRWPTTRPGGGFPRRRAGHLLGALCRRQGDAANNAKLLDALKDVPQAERGAQFVCVLALVRHADDPLPILCEGLWHGAS